VVLGAQPRSRARRWVSAACRLISRRYLIAMPGCGNRRQNFSSGSEDVLGEEQAPRSVFVTLGLRKARQHEAVRNISMRKRHEDFHKHNRRNESNGQKRSVSTVDGYGYPEGFRSVIYHMIRCILARPTNLIRPGTKMSISCPGQSESQSASHNPHTTRIAVIDLSYMHICLLKATTRP
jgi:hypothetical protein